MSLLASGSIMGDRKKVTGIIQVYSRNARDQIFGIGYNFAKLAGVPQVSEDLMACVDELIKNAVKANYKFLLILDRVQEQIIRDNPRMDPGELKKNIFSIIRDKKRFDEIASKIAEDEDISSRVRDILNEEGRYLRIKNRAYQEKRDFTDEEKKQLAGFDKVRRIRREMKERDIKILLKIEGNADFVYIEVTNTAPILTQDLNRIYEKRDEYRQYRIEGREYEFFVNNIDTSDSGFGLGYAKIDSFLSNLGLDTENAITIISANNTTAMLSIPLDVLKG